MSHPFDKHYFHGGGKVGGYAGSGYRDFPVHWTTYQHFIQRCNPASVLELGCGRGYLLKRFADYANVPVLGLEISEHCHLTRATENVRTHDVTVTPWPCERIYDLCISMAFLEHIPEDKLPAIFEEMSRRSTRGLHGIDVHDDDGFDKTHVTMRDLSWWKERMPPGHEAVDKEELEQGRLILPHDVGVGIKLNLGSFTHMFHGWRNLDRRDLSSWAKQHAYPFTHWDLSNGLALYDDGIVDMIFLSHVLEHFTYDDGKSLLAECRRVLKPGGLIRVAVPDLTNLVTRYEQGYLFELREICGVDVDHATDARLFHELLYGDDHRSVYDTHTLITALETVELANCAPMEFGKSTSPVMQRETIDQYPDVSLYVEARR